MIVFIFFIYPMSRDYQRQMKIENFVKANTDKFHEIYDTMKEEQICYDKK